MSNSTFNVLITAGGTSEPIDNVRTISNTGTGRLGSLIADAFAKDASVGKIFYVCARDSVRPSNQRVTCVVIQSVADLQSAVREIIQNHPIHAVIHSMAVSDYTVRSVSTVDSLAGYLETAGDGSLQERILRGMDETDSRAGSGKLSSKMKSPLLLLEPTPKVLPMIRELAPDAVLVGFKLLSQVSQEELLDTAHSLLIRNQCDYVFANDSTQIEGDRHHGYLMDSQRNIQTFNTKQEIAEGIARTVRNEVSRR